MTQKTDKRKTRAQAKKKSEQRIQIIAGIIVLLVIAGIVWAVVASQKPAASAQASQSGQPAQTSANAGKYSAYPAMTIDKAKKYTATFKMAKGGSFTAELYPDKAEKTVNSFVFLAREKYFDGTTFHRVLEGFMAQGGDPTGTGAGGPGYEFVNEDSDLKFDKPGVLAMANAGRDTNGSQFFITFGATPQLDGGYTIFGQVTDGMDVVNAITRRDPQTNPNFTGDVIESVTITEK
jgi:cyclophilin family peptidyl-prolyl cis-trans isomerase